jgi:hypothetical protein
MISFRIRSDLVGRIRADLMRPHVFAHERVGFIHAVPASAGATGLAVSAQSYFAVRDEDYIDDPRVGALMGANALRAAMQRAYHSKSAVFHIHMHMHPSSPWFSGYDLVENHKFMPDFFHVSAQGPHGALVLSEDAIAGICWRSKSAKRQVIAEIVEVGAPLVVHRPNR